jgi:hypothetical protein
LAGCSCHFSLTGNTDRHLSPVSAGNGPERAIFLRACEIIADNSGYWHRSSSAYAFPTASHPDDEGILCFKTCGSIFLLAFLVLGYAPLPLCPITFLTILLRSSGVSLSDKDFLLSLDLLRRVHPTAAQDVEPWFVLRPDQNIRQGDLGHPLSAVSSLLAMCGLQV